MAPVWCDKREDRSHGAWREGSLLMHKRGLGGRSERPPPDVRLQDWAISRRDLAKSGTLLRASLVEAAAWPGVSLRRQPGENKLRWASESF